MVAPTRAVLAARAADASLDERHWQVPLWPAVVMQLDQVATVRLPLEYTSGGAAHAALEAEMVRGMVVTADPDLYREKPVPLYVLDPPAL